MKIFIIGATGFLGYHATKIALQRGHQVATVSLPPKPAADLLPEQVECTLCDINDMTDQQISDLFKGFDAVVFAAGRDERTIPEAPAWDFFKKHNVDSCSRVIKLAAMAGCSRGVVLNSYFAYFDRIWPEYELSKHHPYIRSRVMQAEEAIKAGGEQMDVMILELPYIFGSIPGRTPLWKDVLLDGFLERKSIACMGGGTAAVTARQVGQVIVGAVEKGQGGKRYPVGGVNMVFTELYRKLADIMNLKDKKLTIVPKWLIKIIFRKMSRKEAASGLESGANHVRMADIYYKNTFIDPLIAREELGVEPDDFEAALKETVAACYPDADN
ncbi:MAG: NAD(P)H-binding protein [Spirochaetales bacterium]|nr:NAD(P)H-binding protein [Spirochaetales bacterium]